jgi:REP element-mobilizing transposase RayT
MARKLRLEYPGAVYHIISRGNYRADVFAADTTKAAFEACLLEAAAKSGWRLHAFAIMSNHFHLLVETPAGNLVLGMRWLLATFAARFNRLRDERGHVFQGRYKSLLVEAGSSVGQVGDYIHLNPVRAGLVPVGRLAAYRYSSYWYLPQPKQRPGCLQPAMVLAQAGGFGDNPAGWNAYAQHLAWQAASGPAGDNAAYVPLSQGWALGSDEFKQALITDHALRAEAKAWEAGGAREIREAGWRERLRAGMAVLGKTTAQTETDPKSATWKIALAAWMKAQSQASNGWLVTELQMGAAGAVSRMVGKFNRGNREADADWQRLTAKSEN